MKKNKINKENAEKVIKYNDLRQIDFYNFIFKSENIPEDFI